MCNGQYKAKMEPYDNVFVPFTDQTVFGIEPHSTEHFSVGMVKRIEQWKNTHILPLMEDILRQLGCTTPPNNPLDNDRLPTFKDFSGFFPSTIPKCSMYGIFTYIFFSPKPIQCCRENQAVCSLRRFFLEQNLRFGLARISVKRDSVRTPSSELSFFSKTAVGGWRIPIQGKWENKNSSQPLGSCQTGQGEVVI